MNRTFRQPGRMAAAALTSLGATVALLAAPRLQAQSAQPYSVQMAVLFTSFKNGTASTVGGVGIEPQFRLNSLYAGESFGALSLGVGGQYTKHTSGRDDLTIAGLFLEPRWLPALGTSRVAPYLSLRLSLLQQSSNFGTSSGGAGFGAGGGFAIKLTKTINLDAGAQLVRQQFGDFQVTRGTGGPQSLNPFTTYAAKAGFSMGFPSR